ncbi:MAG: hypothetical protein IJY05_04330 [Clostridia bacterium]|nr:hypothetical protein [Clostridia bacterium]
MGKKIKDFTKIDFLKEQLDIHIFSNWIAVIAALCFFFLGMYYIDKGIEVLYLFSVSLMFVVGIILCYPRLKRLREEIERLEKEKKEKNEGIEEKQA